MKNSRVGKSKVGRGALAVAKKAVKPIYDFDKSGKYNGKRFIRNVAKGAVGTAVGLTATVAKTSAGAINYTPVAKVTNISQTIEELKKQGLWFVCADMGGETMYNLNLKGPIGLVIGNEGNGVSRLVKDKCDFIASIPMKGDIDSLNASVAAGVLAYEIVRQRLN